jgi:hypothetical protein
MKTKDKYKKSRNREVETDRQPHLSGRMSTVGGPLLDFSTPNFSPACAATRARRARLYFATTTPCPLLAEEGPGVVSARPLTMVP